LPFCHRELSITKPGPSTYPTRLDTIVDHIHKRRKDLHLLQREVAVIIGVDTMTMNSWETERVTPHLRTMPRMIEFLGYNPLPEGRTIGERLRRFRLALGLSCTDRLRKRRMDRKIRYNPRPNISYIGNNSRSNALNDLCHMCF